MNEKHVCSRELSQKLKANGYPQKGEFCYAYNMASKYRLYLNDCSITLEVNPEMVVAPLASELLEEMQNIDIDIFFRGDLCGCFYYYESGGKKSQEWTDENMNICNALAKMALYLVKEGILKWKK